MSDIAIDVPSPEPTQPPYSKDELGDIDAAIVNFVDEAVKDLVAKGYDERAALSIVNGLVHECVSYVLANSGVRPGMDGALIRPRLESIVQQKLDQLPPETDENNE